MINSVFHLNAIQNILKYIETNQILIWSAAYGYSHSVEVFFTERCTEVETGSPTPLPSIMNRIVYFNTY